MVSVEHPGEGWWAEHTGSGRWPWQPTLQTAGGCLSLPVYFRTPTECEAWIGDNVLGRGLLAAEEPEAAD